MPAISPSRSGKWPGFWNRIGAHLPEGLPYFEVPGLSTEVRQKLSKVQPATLGQAARIPGVTPAAIAVLDVYLGIAR